MLFSYTTENIDAPHIKIHFFTRQGGVSKEAFSGLNCVYRNKENPNRDDDQNIDHNRRLVLKHIGEKKKLIGLDQIHSNKIITIDDPLLKEHAFNDIGRSPNPLRADGLVTKLKHIALSIITADCTPILLADTTNNIIGALHAGWRGAFENIIENGILAMEHLGAKRQNIHASLGPCIHLESYEVDFAFHQKFVNNNQDYDRFFKPGKKDHFYFDLPNFCKQKLSESKITSISQVMKNTYTNKDEFFSCRRSFHEQQPFGCQMSLIVME